MFGYLVAFVMAILMWIANMHTVSLYMWGFYFYLLLGIFLVNFEPIIINKRVTFSVSQRLQSIALFLMGFGA